MSFGVPGFFGRKRRSRKPVALDLSFAYDTSGSMNFVIEFLRDPAVIVDLELSLQAQSVGLSLPNRHSKSEFQRELAFTNTSDKRWMLGPELLLNSAPWGNASGSVYNLAATEEDVTGSAWALATALVRRQYRSGIQRVLVSASDEQTVVTKAQEALDVLTTPGTAQIFVAMSGIKPVVQPSVSIPAGFVPFGQVFSAPPSAPADTSGILIVKGANGTIEIDVPSGAVDWSMNGRFSITGPMYVTGTEGMQTVNTWRLSRMTNGAIYDIDQIINGEGLDLFAESLGRVLGSLLYEKLS